jgi:hypothetical protein
MRICVSLSGRRKAEVPQSCARRDPRSIGFHIDQGIGRGAIERLLAKTSFAPEAAASIKLAYEKTLLSLRPVDRNDPITEMIAGKVIVDFFAET